MPKGWTKIKTVNDVERKKTDSKIDNSFNVLIRNTQSLPIEKLKEKSEILYIQKKTEEDRLLDAFENKKLKSKTAIKRALQLKKQREKLEAKKAKMNTKQNTDTDSTQEEAKENAV